MGASRMGARYRPRSSARSVLVTTVFVVALVATVGGLVGCGGSSQLTGGGPRSAVAPHIHVAGEDCSKCHDKAHGNWAMSLHAASASDALLSVAHNKAEVPVTECLHCMAPFQEKATIGAFVTPLNRRGPWKLLPAASGWQAIGCEVCHDPSSKAPFMLAFYNGTTGTYEPVQYATTLCEKCHQAGTDDSRDLKGSVHEGIECVQCHLQSDMNFSPKGSCAQCHPAIGPGAHPDVTKLDTTYKNVNSKNNIHFVTCKSCHPKTIPPLVEQAKE
jgi:hypothetical protein